MLAAQTVLTAAVFLILSGALGSVHYRTASPLVAHIQRENGGWYLTTGLLLPIAIALAWSAIAAPRRRWRWLVLLLAGLVWIVVLLALALFLGLMFCNVIPGGSCL